MSSTTPPIVSGGLPVIGHVLEMMSNRQKLMRRGYEEHGDLFTIKLGSQPVLIVTGADYNREFYLQTDKRLNIKDGYSSLKEAFGEVLFIADKEKYYNERPALQEIFRRDRMLAYIDAMNVEVQKWLDSLGQSGEVDMSEAMFQLTQAVAARAFIGPDHEKELDNEFWKAYEDISGSLDIILPPNLPLPKFIRRDRAKKVIQSRLATVISKRRANPENYDDIITTLLNAPMKDGTTMADEDIVTMFMALLFAGHETTAGQAAWMIAELIRHPDYLEQVQTEIQNNVAYGQPIDAALLTQLNHIYWAVDETTRLHPSADMQIRTVEEPMTFGDYEIPVGWRVMVNSANSHFLPEIYDNPQQFDPLRYSPERDEGSTFAIVGFGGGIHKCTGMNFAKNEMAVITSLLFQQFEVELLTDDIHVVMGKGANRPSEIRVRYQRKPLSELTDADTIQEAVAAGCPHMQRHAAAE